MEISNNDLTIPLIKKKRLNASQLFLLFLNGVGFVCVGASFSLIAPFFPKEAESKGITPSQYGFVFSIYQVIVFIYAPFVSKLLHKLSPKFLICIGLFIAGYSYALFGLLRWSPPGLPFFVIALSTRAISAFGGTSFQISSYTSATVHFPNHLSQIFAIFETLWSFGIIVGPAIGGLLFDLGGFCLPFFAVGLFTLSVGIMMSFVLPNKQSKEFEKSISLWKILKDVDIVLNISLISVNSALFGFNDATLDHHLREFIVLSPTQTGSIFLLTGLVYGGSTPFIGWVVNYIKRLHRMGIFGLFLSISSFILIGPVYGIPLQPSIPLVIISQVLFGLSMGIVFIGPFIDSMNISKKNFPNTDAPFRIPGIISSSVALGSSIGPAIGGILLDQIGYRQSCAVLIFLQIFLLIIACCRAFYR